MAPKKVKRDSGNRKPKRITVEFKKEIITKYENGCRVSNIARQYNMAQSTICTILKNKEAIKVADVAKGVTVITKQRPNVIEKVEKLLSVWINEKQLTGGSVSEAIICEKARQLHSDLLAKTPGSSADGEHFKASRGWFERFRRRSGFHSVRHGSNEKVADAFVDEFAKFVEHEGYVSHQVFNCDETGLFWKEMPKRTYITQEEKALPGHKPIKDRLTLLLCGNASGDCKIKPLLVYHSENPCAFKHNNVLKAKLPLMWRANSKAWVTRILFMEWLTEVFAPTVKKYLEKMNLPLKCLLVMDNAPAHPPGLEEDLGIEHDFIKVKFLPPNATPLLQPMDQQVISSFKKLYTKALFSRCFQVTNNTNLTLRDFWKEHFNILHCINLIDKAWNEVSYRTLQLAWKKLWPNCVAERGFGGFEAETEVQVVDEIVSMGKSMGLEVNDADMEELVEDHREELTTEELLELQSEQVKAIHKELLLEEEEDREKITSAQIKDICSKWSEVQEFIEKHHPDKVVASRAINILNDNAMSHFRKILQQRKRQISLDRFHVQKSEKEPSKKFQNREKKTRHRVAQCFYGRGFPFKAAASSSPPPPSTCASSYLLPNKDTARDGETNPPAKYIKVERTNCQDDGCEKAVQDGHELGGEGPLSKEEAEWDELKTEIDIKEEALDDFVDEEENMTLKIKKDEEMTSLEELRPFKV
ncbi:tigger transposable element-derived protein 1-like isoform X3 [Macrobrachium rosenbergii]|uniref:tigger transposable element-derived protein 1-like isoform X3 n=1 Tax=Macrobrachium rosenbergii TaxID=79674 RepID=UPI0034D3BB10